MAAQVTQIEACEYAKLSANTPVINYKTLGYSVFIHLPQHVIKHNKIYHIHEIHPKVTTVDLHTDVKFDNCRPWIQFFSSKLNCSIGLHTYKIDLVNDATYDTSALYFSYIIQDDNPDKPYVYMKESDNED